jgi:hypothetical protein
MEQQKQQRIYEQAADYLTVIRDMIKHENELVNQRLTWLFTFQGLLFTATGFLWKASIFPVTVLGFIGIISCISIGYTLSRGLNAIKDLLALARDYKKPLTENWIFPPSIGSRRKAIELILPGILLPWVLGIAWIAILIFRVTNLYP